jgi:hypothetical protein
VLRQRREIPGHCIYTEPKPFKRCPGIAIVLHVFQSRARASLIFRPISRATFGALLARAGGLERQAIRHITSYAMQTLLKGPICAGCIENDRGENQGE